MLSGMAAAAGIAAINAIGNLDGFLGTLYRGRHGARRQFLDRPLCDGGMRADLGGSQPDPQISQMGRKARMILETAVFTIHPGQADQFLEAFSRGRTFIEQSKGCHRSRTSPEASRSQIRFILVVWWQTLEDHTVTFKQSSNFTDWRAVVGHFFALPPVVHHFSDEV